MSLQGKTAVVTGGAQGIGLAICRRLALEGAVVAIMDVAEETAWEAVRALRAEHARAFTFPCDVTNYEQVHAAMDAACVEMGSLDILVNNAGIDKQRAFVETDPEFWRRMIAINYEGFLNVTHSALPHMIKQGGGVIVNLGSDAGRGGQPRRRDLLGHQSGRHGVLQGHGARDGAPQHPRELCRSWSGGHGIVGGHGR